MHPYMVDVRGRTQAARTVEVRSETAGDVASTPILQGTFVRQGTVLCRLAVDARRASLDEAMANMKSKKLQMQASASLAAKGFRSPTQVLTDQAALDAATAGVRAAQVALDQVNIRAPFTGVFDHREAEVGAYLAPGQPCGAMIELDPLLIVGDVPETEAGKVHVGATATAKLVSGEAISGRVRFVAHDADPATEEWRFAGADGVGDVDVGAVGEEPDLAGGDIFGFGDGVAGLLSADGAEAGGGEEKGFGEIAGGVGRFDGIDEGFEFVGRAFELGPGFDN